MAPNSRGRGTMAVVGLLLAVAGLVGAAVLWIMSAQRPDDAVESFARGPVGCTVTLEFADAGSFYVYEERVPADHPVFATCEPAVTGDESFEFELFDGDRPLATRADTSIRYDTAVAVGRSVARVEIAQPGRYVLVVRGDDPTTVAAVGRDPDDGVAALRRGAVMVAATGLLLGGSMLLLRRSKRAVTLPPPGAPGPVGLPSAPSSAVPGRALPPPGSVGLPPGGPAPHASWAPPTADRAVDLAPPDPWVDAHAGGGVGGGGEQAGSGSEDVDDEGGRDAGGGVGGGGEQAGSGSEDVDDEGRRDAGDDDVVGRRPDER